MIEKITGTIGFLGFGNMGKAIAEGIVKAGLASPENILIKDPGLSSDFAQALAQKGYRFAASEEELFRESSVVILAVKPQIAKQEKDNWARIFSAIPGAGKTFISIMAGIPSMFLRDIRPSGSSVVRVMPNLGLSVGEGATAIALNDASQVALDTAVAIFGACGVTVIVDEHQMDAVTAVSGSGPMYLFEFIGAMTEAGVKAGLPRDVASKLAVQTAKGSIKLMETSSDTPEAWTKRVCSPGGTTLAALGVLQGEGFHGIVDRAVAAAKKRSQELSA
jgi:pyrroline-5-carboxylate reductase